MTTPANNNVSPQSREMVQIDRTFLMTLPLIRGVGYGLVFLFVIDLVTLLIPASFMDPVWEFQLLGALVERVPVPLIGLAMAFLGGMQARAKWELPLIRFSSYLALIAGVCFFLFVPLGMVNTVRIYRANHTQIATQTQQKLARIEQVQGQLKQTTTPTQMEELIRSLNPGRTLEIEDDKQFAQVKDELTTLTENGIRGVKAQAREAKRDQNGTLLKNSVKWNLGALVSGSLFLFIWRGSRRIGQGQPTLASIGPAPK